MSKIGWVKLAVAASVMISGAFVAAPGALASTSGPLTQVVNPLPTTAILVSADNPAVVRSPVFLSVAVQVNSPGTGTPTGTVSFFDSGTPIGTATLDGGIATFLTSSLSVGSHDITASYEGDGTFGASTSATLTEVITAVPSTTTTLVSADNPSVAQQPVTLQADVSVNAPGTGTPTGTVSFLDGGTLIGTATLDGGVATFVTSSLSAGSHDITANYSSDNEEAFTQSTSNTLTQVVNAGSVPLTVTADDQAMTYGGAVPNFTASYSGFVSGDTSGTVSGLTCGATDDMGNPVSSTTPAGTYPITCSGATAPPYYQILYAAGTLTLNQAPLTITANDQSTSYGAVSFDSSPGSMTFAGLVNSEDPSVLGDGLTISSDVQSGSPAGTYALTPAGAVDGNYSITYISGALTVNPATLLVTASSPTVTYNGSPPVITPIYSGLANSDSAPATPPACGSTAPVTGHVGTYTTSCSGASDPNYTITYATGTLTVSQAVTSTSLSSSPDPSAWGQSVTFTAHVSVSSPGAGSPTGTVEFKDGPNDVTGCGSVPLGATGTATCTMSALSVASHNVTAYYSGDANFTGSATPSALIQTVVQATTSVAVSSSNSAATAGQSVTFTATVAAVAPGAGTPTGTVTFYDGQANLGTSPVNGDGQATFQTSTLSVGAHSVTASYSGDVDFIACASTSAVSQYIDTNLTKFPKLPDGAYNLSNANLSGDYFGGLSLAGASLTGSNLTNAVFVQANLTDANLSSSNLTGANLTGANLTGANLAGSNLKGANFTTAILAGASLTGASLTSAVLIQANLTGANLSSSNLAGANLTGSDLAGASLAGGDLKGANLTTANLKGATQLNTATLTGVIWSTTTCPDGTVSNQDGGSCAGHL